MLLPFHFGSAFFLGRPLGRFLVADVDVDASSTRAAFFFGRPLGRFPVVNVDVDGSSAGGGFFLGRPLGRFPADAPDVRAVETDAFDTPELLVFRGRPLLGSAVGGRAGTGRVAERLPCGGDRGGGLAAMAAILALRRGAVVGFSSFCCRRGWGGEGGLGLAVRRPSAGLAGAGRGLPKRFGTGIG